MSRTEDREYEFELTAGRAEIAAVLRSVVEGLQAGSVHVNDGEEAVAVDVPEELELEVELELEDGEVSLELELTWPADAEAAAVHQQEEAGEAQAGVRASTLSAREVDAAQTTEPDAATVTDEEGEASAEPRPLARFELFRDRAEEWRWRLRHRNGNAIATSGEGYTRKHNALKGLQSVMKNAPGADVTEPSS